MYSCIVFLAMNESHQLCLLNLWFYCSMLHEAKGRGIILLQNLSRPFTWFHSRISNDTWHKSFLHYAKVRDTIIFSVFSCSFKCDFTAGIHISPENKLMHAPFLITVICRSWGLGGKCLGLWLASFVEFYFGVVKRANVCSIVETVVFNRRWVWMWYIT